MPEKKTLERARAAQRAGQAPSTQAGAFVKEELDKARAGKLAVKSNQQAVAIGLSQARRAGVAVPSPEHQAGQPRRTAAKKPTRKSAHTQAAHTRAARHH